MFQDYILCNSQRFGVQILYRFYMCSVLLLLLFAHFSGSFKKRNSIFFFVNMIFQMPFLYAKEFKESSNQLSPLGGSADYLSSLKDRRQPCDSRSRENPTHHSLFLRAFVSDP